MDLGFEVWGSEMGVEDSPQFFGGVATSFGNYVVLLQGSIPSSPTTQGRGLRNPNRRLRLLILHLYKDYRNTIPPTLNLAP